MNFFSAQDDARKKTYYLLFLFVLAVIALVILTNIFVMVTLAFFGAGAEVATTATHALNWQTFSAQFSWPMFGKISAAVIAVIFFASLYKTISIGQGGRRVAESMGGRLIFLDNAEGRERVLLNVVEEMAIASGHPVPLVYVMDDELAINAFAAGIKPSDAVIVVTRGTLEQLSRDELQGVIAHEFSHIIHGDMRLNMRLVGVLFGILMIGLVGRFLLRSAFYSSSARNNKNNNPLPLLGIGLGFIVLGYLGVFFGNLIKASVSRQREYLADASAVQYTRNPDGIANALKRIGSDDGALLLNPNAAQFSHAYFGSGIKSGFLSLLSTHPPLEDRIRKIQPRWDGSFNLSPVTTEDNNAGGTQSPDDKLSKMAGVVATAVVASDVVNNIAHVGDITPDAVENAQEIVRGISPVLLELARNPCGARAVIYGLILKTSTVNVREKVALLRDKADPHVVELLNKVIQQLTGLPASSRLALFEITIPSLRQLSKAQYVLFSENLKQVLLLGDKSNVFQWALYKNVIFYLEQEFVKPKTKLAKFGSFSAVRLELSILFSLLAQVENAASSHELAFKAGKAALNNVDIDFVTIDITTGLERFSQAIDQLNLLKPLLKPQLLKACVAVVAGDGEINDLELDLLRTISTLLDCPMPPLPIHKEYL